MEQININFFENFRRTKARFSQCFTKKFLREQKKVFYFTCNNSEYVKINDHLLQR